MAWSVEMAGRQDVETEDVEVPVMRAIRDENDERQVVPRVIVVDGEEIADTTTVTRITRRLEGHEILEAEENLIADLRALAVKYGCHHATLRSKVHGTVDLIG